MVKTPIYLTDITLHMREYRPTGNFSKVAEKGRMYSPLPKDYAKNIDYSNNTTEFDFDISAGLIDLIEKDEVEVMIPDELSIRAGKDVYEYIDKMDRKQRNELIHRGRTWHADSESVK